VDRGRQQVGEQQNRSCRFAFASTGDREVVLADFNLPSYSPLLQGIYITVHSTPADESTVISKVDAFEKNLFASDKTAATASN